LDIRDPGAQVTALFRRHQNNSRKLEHRSNKLNNDASEEWQNDSWTDSRRKTTTTPAKPANATAICAAIPRASPGSIVK